MDASHPVALTHRHPVNNLEPGRRVTREPTRPPRRSAPGRCTEAHSPRSQKAENHVEECLMMKKVEKKNLV